MKNYAYLLKGLIMAISSRNRVRQKMQTLEFSNRKPWRVNNCAIGTVIALFQLEHVVTTLSMVCQEGLKL